MPDVQPIEKSIQLLVEGNDEKNFFEAFLRHLDIIHHVQVQSFDGVNQLSLFVETLAATDEFKNKVESLGIVRDAETSAQSAFQSIQNSLQFAGLPIPDQPRRRAGNSPAVSALILPDDDSPGMLETLLCRTFASSSLGGCIDSFLECVQVELGYGPHRPHKARAHAYIATQRDPHVSVGVAAHRKYWDLNHAVFERPQFPESAVRI